MKEKLTPFRREGKPFDYGQTDTQLDFRPVEKPLLYFPKFPEKIVFFNQWRKKRWK